MLLVTPLIHFRHAATPPGVMLVQLTLRRLLPLHELLRLLAQQPASPALWRVRIPAPHQVKALAATTRPRKTCSSAGHVLYRYQLVRRKRRELHLVHQAPLPAQDCPVPLELRPVGVLLQELLQQLRQPWLGLGLG